MENIETLSLCSHAKETPGKILSRTHLTGIALLAILLGALSGYVLAKNLNLRDALYTKDRDASAGPFVQTAQALYSGQERRVKVLGEALPYATVTLYGKVSGYVAEIVVDKGERVKKGQLLATIYSPETNSQFDSAIADERNKRVLATRVVALFRGGDVTEEERDRDTAGAQMAAARVEELSAKRGYTVITAPFDGTVTARFVDPGALVQDAEKAQAGAMPIVTVSQTERLRVTTYINQGDAPFVRVGDPAVITLAERPGISYEARVSRKAGELDIRSRTMLTEIELDNPNEEIVTGGFLDIAIRIKVPRTIQVPSQALAMRGEVPYVAVVGKENRIQYRQIETGNNYGGAIDVLAGLTENDTVVLNVGNSLTEGQRVQISD